jgi:hypothetical protein
MACARCASAQLSQTPDQASISAAASTTRRRWLRAWRHSRCLPLAQILLGRPGPDPPSPDLGSSATTAGTSFAAWKLGRWNLLE